MTAKKSMARKYVTIAEAAEYSGLSVGTIRNLVAMQDLSSFRPVPGRIVLDLEDIERFVRRSRGKSSTRGRRSIVKRKRRGK